MKQEIKDIIVQTAVSAPTSLVAILSKVTLSEWIALIFFVLQSLYLIRKWWREETEFGLKMKRWSRNLFTKPGDL